MLLPLEKSKYDIDKKGLTQASPFDPTVYPS